MESSQEKFIQETLARTLDENNGMSTLPLNCLTSILEMEFVHGVKMEQVRASIMNSLAGLSSGVKNLHNLSGQVQKWITKMATVDDRSRVYQANLFLKGVVVTVKNPRSEKISSTLREYCIGIKAINKLRRILPHFVYTLGAFVYPEKNLVVTAPKPSVFILQETIPGERLDKLLQNGLDFSTWLGLFCQILLALEVAQREVSFTHFDLHAGNVMVRTVTIREIVVLLDAKAYVLKSISLLPVIIDFEASSAALGDYQVGSYDYSNFGMLHLMVQGSDPYRLLVSSYQHASNTETREGIGKLLTFYSEVDPYQGKAGAADSDYCRKIVFSEVATRTPLMLLEWINARYPPEKTKVFTRPRKERSTLPIVGVDKSTLALIEQSLKETASYVLTQYLLYLLRHCNEEICVEKNISSATELALLDKCFTLELPTETEIETGRNKVLNLSLSCRVVQQKRDQVEALIYLTQYESNLKPYLDIYFTILELQLEGSYQTWAERFEASRAYQVYKVNVAPNQRALRWGASLMMSIIP